MPKGRMRLYSSSCLQRSCHSCNVERTFWYMKYKQHNRAHEMSATFPEVKGAPYWLGVSHLFCTGIGCEIDRLLAVKPAVEIRAWWMAARRHLAGGWERRQGEVHSDREAECPKYTPIQRQPWKFFFLIESWTIPEILPVTSTVLRLSYVGLCHKEKLDYLVSISRTFLSVESVWKQQIMAKSHIEDEKLKQYRAVRLLRH